jgi:histidine triad (HIT) family protein
VIPRRHIASAESLGSDDAGILAGLFEVAAQVGSGIDGGWRLVTNVGPNAGQSVFHLHFHILGGRTLAWPPG